MFRLGWDMFGGFLLLCDAILSPINLAWELDMGSETVLGVPLAKKKKSLLSVSAARLLDS